MGKKKSKKKNELEDIKKAKPSKKSRKNAEKRSSSVKDGKKQASKSRKKSPKSKAVSNATKPKPKADAFTLVSAGGLEFPIDPERITFGADSRISFAAAPFTSDFKSDSKAVNDFAERFIDKAPQESAQDISCDEDPEYRDTLGSEPESASQSSNTSMFDTLVSAAIGVSQTMGVEERLDAGDSILSDAIADLRGILADAQKKIADTLAQLPDDIAEKTDPGTLLIRNAGEERLFRP